MNEMGIGQNFQRTQQEEPRVGRRAAPIKLATITAITPATSQTLIIAPVKRAIEVKSLMISNITALAATVNLYAVPTGGPTDDTTVLIKGVSIPGNSSNDWSQFINRFYEAGTSLKACSGTASALRIMGFVDEVF